MISWTVDAASSLWFELTDPCNFITDGSIDFVWAFEHLLTTDRALRLAMSALAASSSFQRISHSFETADLFAEVAHVWNPTTDPADFMKGLFNPTSGQRRIDSSLSGAPSPIRDVVAAASTYDDLRKTVLDSIWFGPDRKADHVLVRNRSLTGVNKEKPEDFVANVMRTLRNAHHGYFTKSDPGKRPSRYLAPITGNTPDSLSSLPLIWWLALLASPRQFVGWSPLPMRTFD